MNLEQLKQLARKGQSFYANKYMRRQWLYRTVKLLDEGKHLALNGKFPERVH
jgi:hypothetical protein